ncbi:Protein FAM45A, partial [Galemys pyrenaicus]
TVRILLLRKYCLTDENRLSPLFDFDLYRRTWFCITTVEVPESLPPETSLEKWPPSRGALKLRRPVKTMESYSALSANGRCHSGQNGSFFLASFDVQKAYLAAFINDIAFQFRMHENYSLTHSTDAKEKNCGPSSPNRNWPGIYKDSACLVWPQQNRAILHFLHLKAKDLKAPETCTDSIVHLWTW